MTRWLRQSESNGPFQQSTSPTTHQRHAVSRLPVERIVGVQPPMIADELRRQADVFTDLVELQSKLGRDPSERPPREAALVKANLTKAGAAPMARKGARSA